MLTCRDLYSCMLRVVREKGPGKVDSACDLKGLEDRQRGISGVHKSYTDGLVEEG